MPFVTQDHRDHPDYNIAGDRCFVEYKQIMEWWSANPRWTQFDAITSWLFPELRDNEKRARVLAYMVFFCKHIMKYEEDKCKENGDII